MVMTYTPSRAHGAEGIYSDLHHVEKAGDLGMEFTLMYAGTGYHAVVSVVGKDGLEVPVVVPAVVGAKGLEFSVETKDGIRRFAGTWTQEGLVGTFGDRQVKLRRGKSHWQ